MADLLLPTILTLATRGPISAANFLTVLAGTRVTAAGTRTKAANR
ncbi:hypothetical protein Amsp01_018300 [Amycolatopsis sp. NBRC 101858]|nr:hypothetical protein [Amycolatopsis sp. NBRC 101858]GLY35806.1 hypothetical protein Amsp01_018300 [Amycolatopsis sp. NBRC 101858]